MLVAFNKKNEHASSTVLEPKLRVSDIGGGDFSVVILVRTLYVPGWLSTIRTLME